MLSSFKFPPTVSREFAGRWIAWNSTRTKIVSSGRTLEEARQLAFSAGESNPILAKVPRADIRFLGGVR
jgi:hypothetical protein